jgi:TetR/AcrR family transcriptional repressor of nem operon
MARSQAEKARSHEKILKVAGTRFREKGLGGIGVAALMAAAGLTHGGFYCHFKSRRHLVEETLQRVFEDSERIKDATMRPGRPGLMSYIDWYLSPAHRDGPGAGCPLATLAADVRHEGKRARGVFASGLRRFVEWVGGLLGERGRAGQARATFITSAMVGAVILSRAVVDSDAADRILEDARKELLAYLES